MRRFWWLICGLAGLLLVTAGALRGEYGSVKTWADTLCTGCIGLSPVDEP